MSVIVFDSGVGGLSVLREARAVLRQQQFIYIGDDAGFPYGDWQEAPLTNRIVAIFDLLMERYSPDAVIVACNTASTLIMPALRQRFDIPFIGIVPAIKPAAERTASGLISVLATPATVKRPHIRELVDQFANHCGVTLVGATQLARFAEQYMLGESIDTDLLRSEIKPCFIENDRGRTDIIAVGCTHYPFLVNEMRKVAPWPVDWLDPAEAVAHQARAQLALANIATPIERPPEDIAVVTSGKIQESRERLLDSFGLVGRDSVLSASLRALNW